MYSYVDITLNNLNFISLVRGGRRAMVRPLKLNSPTQSRSRSTFSAKPILGVEHFYVYYYYVFLEGGR